MLGVFSDCCPAAFSSPPPTPRSPPGLPIAPDGAPPTTALSSPFPLSAGGSKSPSSRGPRMASPGRGPLTGSQEKPSTLSAAPTHPVVSSAGRPPAQVFPGLPYRYMRHWGSPNSAPAVAVPASASAPVARGDKRTTTGWNMQALSHRASSPASGPFRGRAEAFPPSAPVTASAPFPPSVLSSKPGEERTRLPVPVSCPVGVVPRADTQRAVGPRRGRG